MMAATQTQPNAPKKSLLGSKENALFKSILKFYEHKQYKKGLKAAEQILRKSPDHGETLAMKGLFLSHLGDNRKQEAHDFVKRGLRQDLKSHICWHVYGLLYRGEKNYEEALKCYGHALKYDKENQQIIRDYSLLQIQMRNFEGYTETRHTMLTLKSGFKANWIALAIGYHLSKNYQDAIQILDAYEDAFEDQHPLEGTLDYEHSELLLYKNSIFEEWGEMQKGLRHLEKIKKRVSDQEAWNEAKARYLYALGIKEAAEKQYLDLLDGNPDCKSYLEGIELCKGFKNEGDNKDILEFYKDLERKYPRSHLIKRAPLKYAKGHDFKTMIDSIMRASILKGVPSLFVTLKHLYNEEWRVQIIQDLILSYHHNLTHSNSFDQKQGKVDETKEKDTTSTTVIVTAPPTALLWTLYFMAQHYDYLRDSAKAVQFILEAEQHTPTLPEIFMEKAKIYKHAGNTSLAVEAMSYSRELDLQDRFLNSKCTKYLLRDNQISKAESIISLFTRHDNEDALEDLKEMQCMWFTQESGLAYLRLQNYGKALKKFLQINQHFIDIYDDQFDFHVYCLRKTTLRDYIKLIRLEDRVKGHEFWIRAAVAGIRCYLELIARASVEGADLEGDKENDESKLSESEKKKLARKAKKAAEQAAAAAAAAAAASNTASSTSTSTYATNNNNQPKKPVDEDPEGLKLIDHKTRDLVADAINLFLEPLQEFSPEKMEGWVYGVELYLKKDLFLLAWKSLKKGYKLSPSDPGLLKKASKFFNKYQAAIPNLPPAIANVLAKDISAHPISAQVQGIDKLPAFVSSQQSMAYGVVQHLTALANDSTLHLIASSECMIELFDSPKECLDLLKPLYASSSSKLIVAPASTVSSSSSVKLVLDRKEGTCQVDLDAAVLVFKLLTRSRKVKQFAATNEANGAVVADAVASFTRECYRVFEFVDKSVFGQQQASVEQ